MSGENHKLCADGLVTAPPTFGTPWLGVIPNIPGLKKRLRAKRKPSDKTLVKRAETATGRPAKKLTFAPDGSVTVEVGKAEADEQSNGFDQGEANPWHTI
jgi:hypothetical protein